MNSIIKADPNKLYIFHEGRKRRIFVGELIYLKEKDRYELIYDKKYVRYKNAIPMGPELDLLKLRHQSEKGKLFSSFIDRIPDKPTRLIKIIVKLRAFHLPKKTLSLCYGQSENVDHPVLSLKQFTLMNLNLPTSQSCVHNYK